MKTLTWLTLTLATLWTSAFAQSASPQTILKDPTIALSPQNLRPGDQAVLVIISHFDKRNSKAIELKQTKATSDLQAIEVFQSNNFQIDQTPNSTGIRIYRITLKADSLTLTPSDFSNLPSGFQLPKLSIYREK